MVLFHCKHQEFVTKYEIRSTKHETNIKSEFSNVQNLNTEEELSFVSIIRILVIRICLGFRYSDFGFHIGTVLATVRTATSVAPPSFFNTRTH
jgi:hypothetical protein